MKCYIIGDTMMPIRCAEILRQKGHQVAGIVTRDKIVGLWAKENGIRVAHTVKSDLLAFMQDDSFDYLFGIFNTVMIEEEILRLPKIMAVNYHDSLLPKYAGMYSSSWAIMEGSAKYGVTWHVMEKGADTGDILQQADVSITREDTVASLNVKCVEAGLQAFEKLLASIENNTLERKPQNLEERTYYALYDRPSHAALIDFKSSSFSIEQLVRGLDFGGLDNHLSKPKILLNNTVYCLNRIFVSSEKSSSPSSIVELRENLITISSGNRNIGIKEVTNFFGDVISIQELKRVHNLEVGMLIQHLGDDTANLMDSYYREVVPFEKYWVMELAKSTFLESGMFPLQHDLKQDSIELFLEEGIEMVANTHIVKLFLLTYLAKITDNRKITIGYSSEANQRIARDFFNIFSGVVPLTLSIDVTQGMDEWSENLESKISELELRKSFASDVFVRYETLQAIKSKVKGLNEIVFTDSPESGMLGTLFTIYVDEKERKAIVQYNVNVIAQQQVQDLFSQWNEFVSLVKAYPTIQWDEIALKTLNFQAVFFDDAQKNRFHQIALLENRLKSISGIQDACVIESNGEIVVCMVSTQVTGTMVSELLRQEGLLIPSIYVNLERIPMNAKNQVDKELISILLERKRVNRTIVQPRNEMDSIIRDIWAQVLETEANKICIEKNFFELGGNSLRLMLLLSKVNEFFKLQIDVTVFFTYPNVKDFSDHLFEKYGTELQEKLVVAQ